ncbi:MAG TPA: hemerythrin domain-containing protein [Caulobacteraceae bacterium]|nr:hemerythrin domain-containing protein [Caulobacteraceae bacterium]
MVAVIEALREEHRNIARLLDALERQIDIFAAAGAPDYDVVQGVCDYFLDYPDRCHHPKEDAIARRLADAHPAEAAVAMDLIGEHRAVHERALRFRQTVSELLGETDIARDEVVEAARRFIEFERRHMRREEETFLPLAERLLGPADWRAVESELDRKRDPVFGERVEEKFRALSQRLLAWEAEDEQGR